MVYINKRILYYSTGINNTYFTNCIEYKSTRYESIYSSWWCTLQEKELHILNAPILKLIGHICKTVYIFFINFRYFSPTGNWYIANFLNKLAQCSNSDTDNGKKTIILST